MMNLFSFIDEIARKQVNKAFRQIKRGIVKDHDSNKVVALIPENQGQSKIPVEFLTDGNKGLLFIPKNGARIEIGEPQRKKLRKIIGIYPPDVDKDDHQAKAVQNDEVVVFSGQNEVSIASDNITIQTKNITAVITDNTISITANTTNGEVNIEAPQGVITLSAPQNDVTVEGSQGSYGVAATLKDLNDRITALEGGGS